MTAQIARGVLFHPQCRPWCNTERLRKRAYRKVSPLTSFHQFTLNDAITHALAEEKYLVPTPTQAHTIHKRCTAITAALHASMFAIDIRAGDSIEIGVTF